MTLSPLDRPLRFLLVNLNSCGRAALPQLSTAVCNIEEAQPWKGDLTIFPHSVRFHAALCRIAYPPRSLRRLQANERHHAIANKPGKPRKWVQIEEKLFVALLGRVGARLCHRFELHQPPSKLQEPDCLQPPVPSNNQNHKAGNPVCPGCSATAKLKTMFRHYCCPVLDVVFASGLTNSSI